MVSSQGKIGAILLQHSAWLGAMFTAVSAICRAIERKESQCKVPESGSLEGAWVAESDPVAHWRILSPSLPFPNLLGVERCRGFPPTWSARARGGCEEGKADEHAGRQTAGLALLSGSSIHPSFPWVVLQALNGCVWLARQPRCYSALGRRGRGWRAAPIPWHAAHSPALRTQ